jgi:uncharacterized membrane protein
VHTVKAERGIPLTAMLILFAVGQLVGIVIGFLMWQSIVDEGGDHPEIPLLVAVLGIVGVVGLVGVWFWRRTAVYLVAAVIVIGLVTDALSNAPSGALLTRLTLVAALAWCISEKWELFH